MIISLKNITKTYGSKKGYKTKAIDDLSLEIQQGEMIAIIGKSGCGKSTLLNIISGLVIPDSGKILYDDEELKLKTEAMSVFRKNHIGIIVQNFALINTRTAYENIYLAVSNKKSKKETKNKIHSVAKMLGIESKLECFPFEMSGGECQRVAIARALILNPDIILADEPTGALDITNSQNVINILQRIAQRGKTVIIVTHDINIARKCNRIITISDGRIIE